MKFKLFFPFFILRVFQQMQLLRGFLNEKYKQKNYSRQKATLGNVLVIEKLSETIFKSLKRTRAHPPKHVFI